MASLTMSPDILTGPIKMSIYARIELNNGAEMGVTVGQNQSEH